MKSTDPLKVTLLAFVDVAKTDTRMNQFMGHLDNWSTVMTGGGPTTVEQDSMIWMALKQYCAQVGNY